MVYGELEKGKEFIFKEYRKKGIVYDDPEQIKMGHIKTYDGDIRYTRSKDNAVIYATRLTWPTQTFILSTFSSDGKAKDIEVDTITLLGSEEKVRWKRDEQGFTIKRANNACW